MHHTLRDALTVEVRQVVDQVEVLRRGGGEVRLRGAGIFIETGSRRAGCTCGVFYRDIWQGATRVGIRSPRHGLGAHGTRLTCSRMGPLGPAVRDSVMESRGFPLLVVALSVVERWAAYSSSCLVALSLPDMVKRRLFCETAQHQKILNFHRGRGTELCTETPSNRIVVDIQHVHDPYASPMRVAPANQGH